ncbi:MAG: hypothetical protein ACYDBV_05935 [Nitrospiria bacterium]
MKGWIYTAVIIMIIPLQGLMADYFSIGNIKPDAGFLVIYFTGLLFGNAYGALVGGVVGLIADILSGGTGLVQMESGILLGLTAGVIRKTVLNLRLFFNSIILFVFSLFHSFLIFTFLNWFLKGASVPYPWKAVFFPKGVYDAFLGSFFFWILMKFMKNKDFFSETRALERISFFTARKS